MAKLSEQKKVELLENEVLTGTVENTAKIIAEYRLSGLWRLYGVKTSYYTRHGDVHR